MDIILYGAGLSLEFLALLSLRRKEPNLRRPFKIPLGRTGLILLFLLPLFIYTAALSGVIASTKTIGLPLLPRIKIHLSLPLLFSFAMLFSAAIVWRVIRWRKPHLAAQSPNIK